MNPTMTSLAAIALFVVGAIAQTTFMINTPANVVVCQPTQITWTGGTPPYFLSILPGSQPSAEALEQFTNLQGTSFTWNTNIAAGTSIGLTLRDSIGALAQSAPFTINSSPDTNCLSASSGASSVAGSSTPAGLSSLSSTLAASTPASSSAAAPATSSPTSPVVTPSTGAATTRPASSAGSSSASRSGSASASATGAANNGAVAQVASLGVAAVLGAAVAAVLA